MTAAAMDGSYRYSLKMASPSPVAESDIFFQQSQGFLELWKNCKNKNKCYKGEYGEADFLREDQ